MPLVLDVSSYATQLTFAVLLDPEGPFGLVLGFFSTPRKVKPPWTAKTPENSRLVDLLPQGLTFKLFLGWLVFPLKKTKKPERLFFFFLGKLGN